MLTKFSEWHKYGQSNYSLEIYEINFEKVDLNWFKNMLLNLVLFILFGNLNSTCFWKKEQVICLPDSPLLLFHCVTTTSSGFWHDTLPN